MEFPEPETHVMLAGMYGLFALFSALFLDAFMRAVFKPLKRVMVPWKGTPLYPGDTRPDVEIAVGHVAKVFKIIMWGLGWLVIFGGMGVVYYTCTLRGYIEFVGWDYTSGLVMLAAQAVWPLALWVVVVVLGVRRHLRTLAT